MKTTSEQRTAWRDSDGVYLNRHHAMALLDDFAELEAQLAEWKTWGIIEIAVRNPNVASYMEHWENRATKAEQQLAEAEIRGMEAAAKAVCDMCRDQGMPARINNTWFRHGNITCIVAHNIHAAIASRKGSSHDSMQTGA